MKRTYGDGFDDGVKSVKTALEAADTEIAHLRKQLVAADESRQMDLHVIADAMQLGGPRHFHKDKTHWDGTGLLCDDCAEWWRVFESIRKLRSASRKDGA